MTDAPIWNLLGNSGVFSIRYNGQPRPFALESRERQSTHINTHIHYTHYTYFTLIDEAELTETFIVVICLIGLVFVLVFRNFMKKHREMKKIRKMYNGRCHTQVKRKRLTNIEEIFMFYILCRFGFVFHMFMNSS